MLAPGDGEAEPGEPTPTPAQSTKWATDRMWKKKIRLNVFHAATTVCRQLRRLSEMGVRAPQARLRHRLGLLLSPPASQAC